MAALATSITCTCGRPRLSAACAAVLYPLLLLSTSLLCSYVSGAAFGLALVIAITITIATSWAMWVRPVPLCVMRVTPSHHASVHPLDKGVAHPNGSAATHTPPHPPAGQDGVTMTHVMYLDSMRTVLAILVVVHHCLAAFAGGGQRVSPRDVNDYAYLYAGGDLRGTYDGSYIYFSVGSFRNGFQAFALAILALNQAWLSPAFYFIAAYFVPPSLSSKGLTEFIIERLIRLGLPFLLYFWFVGPALASLASSAVIGGGSYYSPDAGPTWWLAWLVIFSVAYALVDAGPTLILERPHFGVLCACGALLGFVQGVQIVWLPGWPLMPITIGSLPVNVGFFVAGLLAHRHASWLDALPHPHMLAAYAIVCVCAAGSFLGYGILEAGGGGGVVSTNACNTAPSRGDGVSITGSLALSTIAGVFAVAMLVSALHLFRTHAMSRLCSRARSASGLSYAVFVLHPTVLLLLMWIFVGIVRASVNSNAMSASGFGFYGSAFVDCVSSSGDGGGVLFAAWLIVTLLTLVLVVPCAIGVRRMPVLDHVLY